jgi:2-haloacid dehalogenase
VVKPGEDGERVADDDAFPVAKLREFGAEELEPRLEVRLIGVRELRMEDDFPPAAEFLGELVLPVRAKAPVLDAVYGHYKTRQAAGGSMMAVRACVFDVYGTLLDLDRAVTRAVPALGDPAAVARLWRAKQLEYTWTRTLMGRYVDFQVVTEAALDWALAIAEIDDPAARAALRAAYRELAAHDDAAPVLQELRALGIPCVVLSNGSQAMLAAALAHAGIASLIDTVISVEQIGVYKPHPRVYALAVEQLGLAPEQLAFQSANAWDAAGAVVAGFDVHWINRTGAPDEYGLRATAKELSSLAELPGLLSGERR